MGFDKLPAVHEILSRPDVQSGTGNIRHTYRTRLVRGVLSTYRSHLGQDSEAFPDRDAVAVAVARDVVAAARELRLPFPRRVVNGTGILIHTNLGRAPLGDLLDGPVAGALSGYSNLEWDASSQRRGSRDGPVAGLLQLLTGAEAALVVNNCASALLLALEALARDKNVLVSRSELLEIGGGFRVSEIVETGGCRLVEVGTTNKTRIADYEKQARKGPSVFLKVHQSNFVQKGFVESVPLDELGALARKLRVPLVYDNGSGLLSRPDLTFLSSELSMEQGLAAGAGVVVASGDKLVGGVQAGLIVGKKSLVSAMRRHPLYRALRLDKVRLSLIHRTFVRYLEKGFSGIPLWSLAIPALEDLKDRKKRLRLPSKGSRWKAPRWVEVAGSMGGGTNPETTFPSLALALEHKDHSAKQVQVRFASRDVPVAGYIQKGAFFIDIRTVLDEDFPEVQRAIDELG
jgi:L-seryl-tRNA(Ser) seleniumtransferase